VAYSVRALCNGACKVAGHHTFYEGNRHEVYDFPLIVWLIEGEGGPMLVDAGLGDVAAMNSGAAHVMVEPIRQKPEEEIRVQLRHQGYGVEDIRRVLITHLHFDHVDQLDLYVNAEIVVSGRGLAAARASSPSWAPEKTLALLEAAGEGRVLAIDNCEVIPGIDVVWMGGHTPCSQAIYIQTAEGEVALVGDAVFRRSQLESGIPIGIWSDLDEARGAIRSLKARGGDVLPSHDPDVLRRFA
jgi:glyoxylase-like metal-dependent hydrolase (beta-lactamase superfamily II)